jgi:hypothetical protein
MSKPNDFVVFLRGLKARNDFPVEHGDMISYIEKKFIEELSLRDEVAVTPISSTKKKVALKKVTITSEERRKADVVRKIKGNLLIVSANPQKLFLDLSQMDGVSVEAISTLKTVEDFAQMNLKIVNIA